MVLESIHASSTRIDSPIRVARSIEPTRVDRGFPLLTPMLEHDWAGKTAGRTAQKASIALRAIIQQGGGSAASPFLGKCSDGGTWWVKPPVAGMTKALVAEWVVGRLGRAIGAPVCEVALVEIPPMLLPCEFAPGRPLVAGTGCGSRDLAGTPTEIHDALQHRADDDNSRRHAGVFAIVDWFHGDDLQWLLDTSDDWTLHSHDHGWYLPPGGSDWTPVDLRSTVGVPRQTLGDAAGLDPAELDRLATAIEAVTDDVIADVLGAVPADWAIPAAELDCLGWYLAERRSGVASRLRVISQTQKGATA
jgi:hypothetical protein